MKLVLLASLAAIFLIGNPVLAQAPQEEPEEAPAVERFSSEDWCADAITACWSPDRSFFSGIRLVVDIDLNFLIQRGSSVSVDGIRGMTKIGIETDLIGGWLGLQVALLSPGTVEVEPGANMQSYLRTPAANEDITRRTLRTNFGVIAGLTTLDGSLMLGVGRVFYNRNQFTPRLDSALSDMTVDNRDARINAIRSTRESFVYVGLQPVASLRSSLKHLNGEEPTLGPDSSAARNIFNDIHNTNYRSMVLRRTH